MYYNAGQTTDPEAVTLNAMKALLVSDPSGWKVQPCSGVTGKRYYLGSAKVLAEATVARGFTSPYWLTLNQFTLFSPPIALKPGGGEGVPIQVTFNNNGEARTVDIWHYNAEQTTDPEAVAKMALSESPIGPDAVSPRVERTGSGQLLPTADSFIGFNRSIAEETRKEQERKENKERLLARLEHLAVTEHICKGDGSCMFRAVSHQLWLDERYHTAVRSNVATFMRQNPADYVVYFESPDAFATYCAQLSDPKVWGDEITLKALSETLHITIHVITSALERWFLTYSPTSVRTPEIHIFLTYYAPLHYNCVDVPVVSRRQSSQKAVSQRRPSTPVF